MLSTPTLSCTIFILKNFIESNVVIFQVLAVTAAFPVKILLLRGVSIRKKFNIYSMYLFFSRV
jgi:hypothetical protein